MATASFVHCFFYLFGTQEQHVQVQTEIVKFICENQHLFEALVISDDNSYTLMDHLRSMKNPMVWATQVDIQAAADLYATPIYLFTPNPNGSGYQWYNYNKRTLAIPHVQHHHFELAHCSGDHFDCIVDAATMRPSTVPPKLAGEQSHHPQVLQPFILCFAHLHNIIFITAIITAIQGHAWPTQKNSLSKYN